MAMLGWIRTWLDRVACVIGAVTFAQLPEFFKQYQIALSARLDEVKFQVTQVETAASETGKTLTAYIDKFLTSSDPDFSRQGLILQQLHQRLVELSEGLQAIQSATPLTRPLVILSQFQSEVAGRVLEQFHWGFPLSFEGISYAMIGLIVGYALFYTLMGLLRGIGRSFSRSPSKGTSETLE
ncbi:MAG: DUF2937 family protein [Chlamydiia bacterium]|nr:DUF2937 family protein [Chlamydiia bacterium]